MYPSLFLHHAASLRIWAADGRGQKVGRFPKTSALQKTLNARLNRHATDVIADADEDATAGHALKSVKHGIAATVLVEDTSHWIVVFGCEHSQRKKVRELVINGDPVTHILFRDPTDGIPYPKRLTLDRWATAISAAGSTRNTSSWGHLES
jgi:hypothetical protein